MLGCTYGGIAEALEIIKTGNAAFSLCGCVTDGSFLDDLRRIAADQTELIASAIWAIESNLRYLQEITLEMRNPSATEQPRTP